MNADEAAHSDHPAPNSYFAFLSYSHKDSAVAERVHKALETYRIPEKLRRARQDDAPPARLHPIFRDREELSAGNDLTAQVTEALASSRALVVLCSPDAAASEWVAKEIGMFRALHPDRPVLAALIRGEPEEAFPQALIGSDGREPVAADFRRGGDGRQLATLKLVAGLTGLPLDALVQRDAQRQFRRVTAITLAALAMVLVLATLLVFAIRARAEAERQRVEAEGLVEYMLTDLRDRLKGVGRLDVMTAVNERAMGYYGAQGDLSGLPADSLERRTRILHAMGEDDSKRGDMAKALVKFTEAHRTTAAILAQSPNDPAAVYAHAQSEFWVGYGLQQRGDYKTAMARYMRLLTLSERFAAMSEDKDKAQKQLAWAHNALASLYLRALGQPKEAFRHATAYRQILDEIVSRNPRDGGNLFSLADALSWEADSAFALKDYRVALDKRQKQVEILDRMLAMDPSNDQWVLNRISLDRSIFRICYRTGDNECAANAINAGLNRLGAYHYDAANLDWVWQAAYVHIDRAYLAKRLEEAGALARHKALANALAQKFRAAADHDPDMAQELDAALAGL